MCAPVRSCRSSGDKVPSCLYDIRFSSIHRRPSSRLNSGFFFVAFASSISQDGCVASSSCRVGALTFSGYVMLLMLYSSPLPPSSSSHAPVDRVSAIEQPDSTTISQSAARSTFSCQSCSATTRMSTGANNMVCRIARRVPTSLTLWRIGSVVVTHLKYPVYRTSQASTASIW